MIDEKTQEALSLIHRGNHILYKEVGRICKKHGLTYFLDSGNLIGAVREHDDIPWDDDADIAMTRHDFEIFRKVAKQELGEEFAFVEPWELDGAFYDFVPRIVLIHSSVRKDSPEEQYYDRGIRNHIGADFFILDDVSDKALKHKLSHALLVLVYGMCMGRRFRLDLSEYHGVAKAAVAVLSLIGRLFPVRVLTRWYDKIGQMEHGENKKNRLYYYHNCLFPDLGKVFKAEWYDEVIYLPVGEDTFPCPAGYDGILRTLYKGDYMVPPPEDKRVTPHCDPRYVTLDARAGKEA